MLHTITMAGVLNPGAPDPVMVPVVAVCFGLQAEPLPQQDQEREFRIQAEMLRWARTGDFDAHAAANVHKDRMYDLIKGRSELACAWIAEQKGLSDA